jgi:hypothetical protein
MEENLDEDSEDHNKTEIIGIDRSIVLKKL